MQLLPAGPGEKLLWALLALVVLGFMAGAWVNRRRVKQAGEWLQAGLPRLGGTPSWRFARGPSSGAEVSLKGTVAPLRQAEIGFYLMTREFLPLLALERLRGKRDLLAVRADLRIPPAGEFEVIPSGSGLQRTLDQASGDEPWRWIEMPKGLGMGVHGAADEEFAPQVHTFLERFGAHVLRLSLRQRQPNVMLFLDLSVLRSVSSNDLFHAFHQVVGPPSAGGGPS